MWPQSDVAHRCHHTIMSRSFYRPLRTNTHPHTERVLIQVQAHNSSACTHHTHIHHQLLAQLLANMHPPCHAGTPCMSHQPGQRSTRTQPHPRHTRRSRLSCCLGTWRSPLQQCITGTYVHHSPVLGNPTITWQGNSVVNSKCSG